MKEKFITAHMRAAFVYAELSSCVRRKVGCVIVKNGTPIAIGYNGTPSGEDNCCETEENVTKPNVIHAEDNALRKLTKSSESAEGAIMFVTTAPCESCASRIIDAGISKVYYVDLYRNKDGIDYLNARRLETHQLPAELFPDRYQPNN